MKKVLSLAVLLSSTHLFAGYVPPLGQGQSETWTGAAGDGNWATAQNWSGKVLPSATIGAYIPGGSTINVDGASSANWIETTGSGSVLINGGGTLQIAGLATTNGASLSFGCNLVPAAMLHSVGDFAIANGGTFTLSYPWTGSGDVTVQAGATMTLQGSNNSPHMPIDGNLINQGTVSIIDCPLTVSSNFVQDGTLTVSNGYATAGTWTTGGPINLQGSQVIGNGPWSVNGATTINFLTATNRFTIPNSYGQPWTGTVCIEGWVDYPNNRLQVGNNASGLSVDQLNDITFQNVDGQARNAYLSAYGYITPNTNALQPVFTFSNQPPAEVNVAYDGNLELSVSTSRPSSTKYQWQLNGTNLDDITPNYIKRGATGAADGSYDCVVTSDNLVMTSTVASVVVGPKLLRGPLPQKANGNGSFEFTTTATGGEPLQYQWLLNGDAISGATNSSYGSANAQPSDAGSYSVVVSNRAGSVTSEKARLVVLPYITVQPTNSYNLLGDAVTLTLTAIAPSSEGNLHSLWYYKGWTYAPSTTLVTDNGATRTLVSTFNFKVGKVPASIYAYVQNADGGTNSAKAYVTEGTENPLTLSITAPANNVTLTNPASVVIAATATTPNIGAVVTNISYYVGSTLLGSGASTTLFSPSAGSNTINIVASDSFGTTTTNHITFTVDIIPTGDLVAPNVYVSAPASGPSETPITIDVLATNVGAGTIASVQLFVNSDSVATNTASTNGIFVFNWTPTSTEVYTLSAAAWTPTDVGGVSTNSTFTSYAPAAPIVVLSPASETLVNVSRITLSATATAVSFNSTITNIEFYDGSTDLGNASSVTINNPTGTHTYYAVASDSYGTHGTNSSVITFITTIAPTIAITTPNNALADVLTGLGIFVSTTTDTANGVDIANVKYYMDGTLAATVSASPWNGIVSPATLGVHTVYAVITDSEGKTGTSGTVSIDAYESIPPTVSITPGSQSLTNVSSITLNVLATVNSLPSGGTIVNIELFDGSTDLGNTEPLAINSPSIGTHIYKATALDSYGAKGTNSVTITFVNTVAPTIAITTANNTIDAVNTGLGIMVSTTTDTANGVTIASVQYYLDGTLASTASSSPWNGTITPTTTGTHSVNAVIADSQGKTNTSSSIGIIAYQAVSPTVTLTPASESLSNATSITLNARATANSTPATTISSLVLYDGTTNIGTPPATINTPTGTHTYSAIATDAYGVKATNTTVITFLDFDTTPPVVSLGSASFVPVGATNYVTVAVTPHGAETIQSVTLLTNGTAVVTTNNAGTNGLYTLSWAAPSTGTYLLTATASTPYNVTGSSANIPVFAYIPAGPLVSLSPASQSFTNAANITLSATATAESTEATITNIAYYDGTYLGDTPTVTITNPAGTHTYYAVASDSYGIEGTNSSTIQFISIAAGDLLDPEVTISPPPSIPAALPAFITIIATNNGPGTISEVQLLVNDSLAATSTNATNGGYVVSWTPPSPGTYSLQGTATTPYDYVGLSAISNITVTAYPPPATPSISFSVGSHNGLTTSSFTHYETVSIAYSSVTDPSSGIAITNLTVHQVVGDNDTTVATVANPSSTGTVTASTLNISEGAVYFYVVSTDQKGTNSANSDTCTANIIPEQPATIALASPTNGAYNVNTNITFGSNGEPLYTENIGPMQTTGGTEIDNDYNAAYGEGGGTSVELWDEDGTWIAAWYSVTMTRTWTNLWDVAGVSFTLASGASDSVTWSVDGFDGTTWHYGVLSGACSGYGEVTSMLPNPAMYLALNVNLDNHQNWLIIPSIKVWEQEGYVAASVTTSQVDGDPVGVDYYVDGTLNATGTGTNLTLTPGTHLVYATAQSSGFTTYSATNTLTCYDPIAPTVTISPLSERLTNITSITINATATAQSYGSVITNLTIYDNGNSLGTTPSLTISSPAAGTHVYSAIAFDSYGVQGSATSTVQILSIPTGDLTAPTVILSAPLSGPSGTPIAISVAASNNGPGTIQQVVLLVNGSSVNTNATGTSGVYTFTWTPTATSQYTIGATAATPDGYAGTASTEVFTSYVPYAPTVRLTPASQTFYDVTSVTLNATATPVSYGAVITNIELYDGGTDLGHTIPLTINSPAGTHAYSATATDSYGNKGGATNTLIFNAVAEPTVTITSPSPGSYPPLAATWTEEYTITASSTSAGTVTNISIYGGNTLLSSANAGSISFNWMGNTGSNGLTAVVQDNLGLSATSSVVSITILPWDNIGLFSTYGGSASDTSDYAGHTAAMAFDGNLNTYWQPALDGFASMTRTWPAGSAFNVHAFTIFFNGGSEDIITWSIDLYANGNWINSVASGTAVDSLAPIYAAIPPVAGVSQARLNRTDNSNWEEVDEWVIWSSGELVLSPANGTVITSSSCTLSSSVIDPNSVNRVTYYANGSLVGSSSTSPYNVTWTPPAGTNSLYAVLSDSSGTNIYSATNTVYGTLPPLVALNSPANNATLNAGTITFIASATDQEGQSISSMCLVVGGTTVGTSSSGSISASPTLGAGTYAYYATAGDGYATAYSATNTLYLTNYPPVVAIVTPTNGTTTYTRIPTTITVTAADTNLVTVTITANGTTIGTTTNGTGSVTWTPSTAGSYQIVASGTDTVPLTTKVTNTVTVLANVTPLVVINNPTNNAIVGTGYSFSISATATDEEGQNITGLSVVFNGSAIGTTSGTTLTASSTAPAAGSYTYYAVATDPYVTGYSATNTLVVSPVPVIAFTNYYALISNQVIVWTLNTNIYQDGSPLVVIPTSTAHAVAGVQFYDNGTLLGSGTTNAFNGGINDAGVMVTGVHTNWYAFNWQNPAVGQHTITGVATDTAGVTGTNTLNYTVSPGYYNLTGTTVGNATGVWSYWYCAYESSTPSTAKTSMTWSYPVANFWDYAMSGSVNNTPGIAATYSNPGSSSQGDSLWVWTAPQTGTVNLDGIFSLITTSSPDGVQIRVLHGNTVIYPSSGWITLTDNTSRLVSTNVSVTAGDLIVIQLSAVDGVNGACWTYCPLYIAYTGGTNMYSAPTVNLTGVTSNVQINNSYNLTATASDHNHGGVILSTVLQINGTTVSSALTNSCSYLWTPSTSGTYTIAAVAMDNYGIRTTNTTTVTAGGITWGTPGNISGNADVSLTGGLITAYNFDGTTAVVNGVNFVGTSTVNGVIGNNMVLSGWYANFVGLNGTGAPFTSLSSAYQTILSACDYCNNSTGTIILTNLTVGHAYAVQMWVNDCRSAEDTRTMTVNGGANTVTLAVNTTQAQNGVGQYTIGTFTAPSTEDFGVTAVTPNPSPYVCAIQLRDLNIPSVIVNSPIPGGSYAQNLPVTNSFFATSAYSTISSVQSYLDGTSVYSGTGTGYTNSSSALSLGSHTYTEVATDANGVSWTNAVTFTVVAYTGPTVSITSPTTGSYEENGTVVTLTATASTSVANDGIANVTFSVNGTSYAVLIAAPYTTTWTAYPGAFTIAAKATDSFGSNTTTSVTVTSDIRNGLLDEWLFDNSLSDAVGPRPLTNGVPASPVTYTSSGIQNDAVVFNGANWVSTTPAEECYFATDSFTLSLWAQSTETSTVNVQRLMGGDMYAGAWGNFTNFQSYVWMDWGGGVPNVAAQDTLNNYWNTTSTGANIADGNWHMISWTVNRTNGAAIIYVDGVQTGSITVSTTGNIGTTGVKPWCFGFQQGNTGSEFTGNVDDARVYQNMALNSTQISQLYNAFKLYHLDDAIMTPIGTVNGGNTTPTVQADASAANSTENGAEAGSGASSVPTIFNGLFYETNRIMWDHSGAITLSVADTNFNGQLMTKGVSYDLAGSLDINGKVLGMVPRTNDTTLTLQLTIASNSLTGSVTDGGWKAALQGEAVVPGTNAPIAYTLTFQGGSFGTLVISNNVCCLSGSLPDGTLFSGQAGISSSGQWPLYQSEYDGLGGVLGWFQDDVTNVTGTAVWLAPGAAAQSIQVSGVPSTPGQ